MTNLSTDTENIKLRNIDLEKRITDARDIMLRRVASHY